MSRPNFFSRYSWASPAQSIASTAHVRAGGRTSQPPTAPVVGTAGVASMSLHPLLYVLLRRRRRSAAGRLAGLSRTLVDTGQVWRREAGLRAGGRDPQQRLVLRPAASGGDPAAIPWLKRLAPTQGGLQIWVLE
jgi:hypothetical protein